MLELESEAASGDTWLPTSLSLSLSAHQHWPELWVVTCFLTIFVLYWKFLDLVMSSDPGLSLFTDTCDITSWFKS